MAGGHALSRHPRRRREGTDACRNLIDDRSGKVPDLHPNSGGLHRGEREHQATRGQDPRPGQRGRDDDRIRSGHPDTAKEKPQEGTVVAVGPGRWDEDGEKRIPLDVSEGDTVIYSKYGGTEIKYNSEEYLILSARDVLAVVNK